MDRLLAGWSRQVFLLLIVIFLGVAIQPVWAATVTITNKGDSEDYPTVAVAGFPYKCTIRWSLDSEVKHLVVGLDDVTGQVSIDLALQVLSNLTSGSYEYTFSVHAPKSPGPWKLSAWVGVSSSVDMFDYTVTVEELVGGFDLITRNEISSVLYQTADPKNTDMLFLKTGVDTTLVEQNWVHADRDGGRAYATFFLTSPGSYRVSWNAYVNNSIVKELSDVNLYVPNIGLVEYSLASEISDSRSLFLYDTGAPIYVLSRDRSLPRWHYDLVADILYGFDKTSYSPGDSGSFLLQVRPRGLGYYIPLAGIAFYVLKQHTLEPIAYAKSRIPLTTINQTITFTLPFVVDRNAEPADTRVIISLAMRDRVFEGRVTYHTTYEDVFQIRPRIKSLFDSLQEQLLEFVKDFGRELFLTVLASLVISALSYRYRKVKRKQREEKKARKAQLVRGKPN